MKNVFKILLSILIFFNHATSFAIGKYYFSGNSDVDWVNGALPFIPEMYYIPTKQINNGDSTSFEFKQVQDLSDLAYVLTADNNLLLVEKYITVEGVPLENINRIEPEEIIHKLDTNRINDPIYRKYLIDKLF